MTDITFTIPTEEESAAIREANPSRKVTYGEPVDGYVKGTEVAKALNKALVDAGFGDRCIPSQMVYNYAKKGYIKTDAEHLPHISVEAAQQFINVQFARRTENTETENS